MTKKSVADACKSWLNTCKRNELERSTLRAYDTHVRIHIEPRIGDLLVADLTRAIVRDFLEQLQDGDVSRAMQKKVLASLRAILNEAVEREWVTHNVASDVKLKRSRRDKTERIIPTKSEIRAILDNAPEDHRALLTTAIFTGMRISELRGLTWEHVDLERRLIRVRQRVDEFGEFGPPKSNAGTRDIPMAPRVVEILTAWQGKTPKTDLGLVFPNGAGKPMNYSNFYNRVFRPMLLELNIVDEEGEPRFSIHALRHAAASLFIEQKWTPKRVQALLGHSSIIMTMDTYGHLFANPDEDQAMFEKLETDLLAA